MSEKKSPPHKEKASSSKLLQPDTKSSKRKLAAPGSPPEEDDKKTLQQKRKRPNVPEGSPEHVGIGSPRGAGTVSRLSVPLSERQQMALLMRMQDESSVGGNQVSSTKRTPADKKVNKRNERGEAPLHMAAKKGDYKQTKRLLKAGASVNMKDYAGWTALHEACNSGNLRVARYLLKAGADVNVQGFDDDTPLHDASSSGHRKLVQLLLRHGANPMQPNLKGKTAINVAISSEIEAILRGTANYSSDFDSHSSSEDSNSSSKDGDRSNIDEDFKTHNTPSKSDVTLTPGTPSSISSTIGSTTAANSSIGNLNIRRQSVPPSPDKSTSTRLLMKLQNKKSSSSSSSATDEQPKAEWDVLPIDTGCEVTSEGDSSTRLQFDRSRLVKPEEPRINLPSTLRLNRSVVSDNDGCADSTVAPPGVSTLSSVPLERIATEPFTPRGIDNLVNSDTDEHGDVFTNISANNIKTSNTFTASCSNLSNSNEINKQQTSITQQPRPQQHLCPPVQQQQQHSHQHIPGQSINSFHTVRLASKLPNSLQTLPSSSIGPEPSGVSSSFQPSSSSSISQRTEVSSSQFSLVSSSSSLPSASLSSTSVLGSGLLSHLSPYHPGGHVVSSASSTTHLSTDSRQGTLPPTLPFQPFAVRGTKGGGSIVTGLSDRAASGGAVSSNSTLHTTAPVPANLSSFEIGNRLVPRMEDKSDTSSCDSPLRVDQEDSNPVPSEHGSRPSTPKVPPLKIIMPPKVGGPSANISKPLAKPALPYVLNPITESEGWDGVEEGGQRPPNCSLPTTQDTGEFCASRPSSRSGAGVSSSDTNSKGPEQNIRNLDVEESASRESDLRAEQTDGSGGKSDEGKEKRPTRTLRSHTAMMQQQQKEKPSDKEKNGSTEIKEEADNCSTTRSQKGDECATDDSSFPPRKRKLRNKTEQQTLQVSAATTTAPKSNQPLEKPPNPYETYLNLRRRIASRHRTLCNVAPKPPIGFKDFLMVNCTYVLQGNATSTLSVPMLPPPNLVTEPMREFFIQQEKERYRLRLQHVIEREKLMLSIEQEILREHGRAARAMANQTLPFSVCTILREEEIYNQQELEQVEDRDKSVRSRYNGRQFISWIQDVDDKYEKIKQLLLMRHHHEAESLYAVQKLDWEWKMKECGLCDHKNTPVIDELHVPMVAVSDEFELLPNS
ncbi:ankyrin repeat domain-containing protein 11-like isoform X2 [Physella acuta]|uniref:ankyrin repeat domain-containing protein 11-like isoform X2 n=1 Tax=Physella acuta TaxID=109671 RepID=UPI0027DC7065|nr:ankyrin repeat domain-containing protein 11-like isoform X2 [Physella acuta]